MGFSLNKSSDNVDENVAFCVSATSLANFKKSSCKSIPWLSLSKKIETDVILYMDKKVETDVILDMDNKVLADVILDIDKKVVAGVILDMDFFSISEDQLDHR